MSTADLLESPSFSGLKTPKDPHSSYSLFLAAHTKSVCTASSSSDDSWPEIRLHSSADHADIAASAPSPAAGARGFHLWLQFRIPPLGMLLYRPPVCNEGRAESPPFATLVQYTRGSLPMLHRILWWAVLFTGSRSRDIVTFLDFSRTT